MVKLGEHFASDDRSRHSEWLRQQRWFIKARQDNQRRDVVEDKAEQDASAFASAVVMATTIEIEEFRVRLDSYDEATIKALMETQKLIDASEVRIEDLLARAYVMDDGRRVFKTEDGTQVFDEHGIEVMPDELDFDLIGSNHPVNEIYTAETTGLAELKAQKSQIIDYQERLDDARDQTADGEYPADDLAELDADLLDAMPDAVSAHVAGLEPVAPAPDLKAGFTATAAVPQMQNAEASAPAPAPFQ